MFWKRSVLLLGMALGLAGCPSLKPGEDRADATVPGGADAMVMDASGMDAGGGLDAVGADAHAGDGASGDGAIADATAGDAMAGDATPGDTGPHDSGVVIAGQTGFGVSSGGGVSASANYRAKIVVGSPGAATTMQSGNHRARIGVAGGQNP